MDDLYFVNKTKEEQSEYLNNRFWKIKYQYNYDFSLSQLLKFSKFSNKKVFSTVNKILLGLTILIWLMFLKIGYKADIIVRVSMVLFIRFFWLLLKIAIFISSKENFKAEIRDEWIIIYSHGNYVKYAYKIKEISNMEMEKYYDGSMPSIKFAVLDKDWIKHYHYWPSDDIIEKFCTDSILYYKKKHINVKIPIDNREPTLYEVKNSISDRRLLLSEDKKLEVKKYLWKWFCIWLWIALFIAIMISLSGDGSESSRGWSFLAFLSFFTIFSIIHIVTFLKWFKVSSVEIKENTIIIRKPNLSYDYIKCSSITDAGYIHFKKEDVEWIKLLIIADWKENIYNRPKSAEIEKLCNDIIDIANKNTDFYSKINSSD